MEINITTFVAFAVPFIIFLFFYYLNRRVYNISLVLISIMLSTTLFLPLYLYYEKYDTPSKNFMPDVSYGTVRYDDEPKIDYGVDDKIDNFNSNSKSVTIIDQNETSYILQNKCESGNLYYMCAIEMESHIEKLKNLSNDYNNIKWENENLKETISNYNNNDAELQVANKKIEEMESEAKGKKITDWIVLLGMILSVIMVIYAEIQKNKTKSRIAFLDVKERKLEAKEKRLDLLEKKYDRPKDNQW